MTANHAFDNQIVKRVAKDQTNPYGIVDAKNIPIDKPCLVVIGGERTITHKDANYYASMMNQLLGAYGIDDVGIYSAYYDYTNTNRNTERSHLFRIAQARIKNQHKDITSAHDYDYIYDLYKSIVLPRIVTPNGKRFSTNKAIKNMQNAILFTHCHGAMVVRTFQSFAVMDLEKYGYDKLEINKIMKSLLVIQHAPVAPLHHSLFNTISFMSASDTRMNFHNKMSEYMIEHSEDLPPSYFTAGNFFVAYYLTHQMIEEHNIIGIVPNKEQDMLTPDGAIIMAAERNTIINAINSVRNGNLAPLSPKELIKPANKTDVVIPDFEELKRNGDFFMYIMRNDLRMQKSQQAR